MNHKSLVKKITFGAIVALATIFFAVRQPTASAAAGYESFDFPAAAYTIAVGISNSGEVVGFYGICNGGCVDHGFLRSKDGVLTSIDYPMADSTNAYDINESGDVVGTYFDTAGQHAFMMDRKGNFTNIDFPDPAACQTVGLGINSRGDVVGYYDLTDPGGDCDGPDLGFIRSADGVYQTIENPFADDSIQVNGINPSGQMVGNWLDDSTPMDEHERAFFLNKAGSASAFDYPGAADTIAFGVNPQGTVTGFYLTEHLNTFGPGHGFMRDRDGVMTELRFPGANKTLVGKINASNEFVGAYRTGAGAFHGFVARVGSF